MTKEEFIRTVQICGYGTKTGAKKYVELNPKEEYGTEWTETDITLMKNRLGKISMNT